VKAATTLDVLSGGRAWLGLGAGWHQPESVGLGFPFPETKTRFDMLEDTLQIAHGMFTGERGTEASFEGRAFTAQRLLNVPQSISRPRVPIMIGGGGERKTLRLVAQYADASNVFGDPDMLRHKYAVLRTHCEAVGRPYEEIERSVLKSVDPERDSAEAIVERWGQLAEAGAQHVIFSVRGVSDTDRLEWVAQSVFPQLRPV
jgi:alkanesulfonate monooxygenase SsuD/methylene tetrahydromethanopterin reductase-like flavin-dependent oxidoreductase (luciferase family)